MKSVRAVFNRTGLILMSLALLFIQAKSVLAETQTLVLQHQNNLVSHLYVIKGSSLSLKNDHVDPVYNINLVNSETGKRVAGVVELLAGGSFRLEFGREGVYRLYYSLNPGEAENANRYVLINVSVPHPA